MCILEHEEINISTGKSESARTRLRLPNGSKQLSKGKILKIDFHARRCSLREIIVAEMDSHCRSCRRGEIHESDSKSFPPEGAVSKSNISKESVNPFVGRSDPFEVFPPLP